MAALLLGIGIATGIMITKTGVVHRSAGASFEGRFNSPQLAALARRISHGDATANRAAVEAFWQERQGKGPLVEPVAGDPHSSWVTFLWKGDSATRSVLVLNGPTSRAIGSWLTRLADTNLWYRTEQVGNDARFIYFFQVNWPAEVPKANAELMKLLNDSPILPDPINPRTAMGPPLGSLLELPEAPPQPWLVRNPAAARGKLIDQIFLSSRLKQQRRLRIYLSPNFTPGDRSARLLIVLDGDGFLADDQMRAPVILDNLEAQKELPPIVAAFVYPSAERDQELSCSEPFADFISGELVPSLRRTFSLSPDPKCTIITGMSTSGMMAAFCGFRDPQVFGNVLSLSGTFYWYPGFDQGTAPLYAQTGWLSHQYAVSPLKPIRFYVSLGRFENVVAINSVVEGRRFRDILQAKGYLIRYREYTGGHDPVGWRGPFVEGLKTLAAATWRSENHDQTDERAGQ